MKRIKDPELKVLRDCLVRLDTLDAAARDRVQAYLNEYFRARDVHDLKVKAGVM